MAASDLWFIIHEEKLAVKKEESGCSVPRFSDVKEVQGALAGVQFFGMRDGSPCFLAELSDPGLLTEAFEFR